MLPRHRENDLTVVGETKTNPIESPFAAVRAADDGGQPIQVGGECDQTVIWKTLLVAEQTFRRLDAPELLAEVAEGVT
jgi:hypothetical protein